MYNEFSDKKGGITIRGYASRFFYREYRLFHYNLHCWPIGLGDDVHTLLQTADTVAARGVDCADIGHRGDAVYSGGSKLGMQLQRTVFF